MMMYFVVFVLFLAPMHSNGVENIKGTMWADTSDQGSCRMPAGDYAVKNALALGQTVDLGNLAWRNGLCGQVLRVNCGGSTVEAVVASNSGGCTTCELDMISRTWNAVTGNKPPGLATCSVTLSTTNPLSTAGAACYIRPYVTAIPYFTSLGVFNTKGRIVKSAQAAGVDGKLVSGSSYFDFVSQGLFTADANVTFRFEDGPSVSFKYKDCKSGGNGYIWS